MRNSLNELFICITMSLLLVTTGQSQIIIKGKVLYGSGNPLCNVNVSVIGESDGSSTNVNGDFSIDLPDEYKGRDVVLTVQFVGFISQSGRITLVFDTNTYDFQLVSEVLSLKPIVVAAQRCNENLQDIPVSISVLDNRDMKSRGIERCF